MDVEEIITYYSILMILLVVFFLLNIGKIIMDKELEKAEKEDTIKMYKAYREAKNIDHYEKQELIVLKTDDYINDEIYIIIDEEEYVHFCFKNNGKLNFKKVSLSDCIFFETIKENETPYVENGVNKKGIDMKYKFYIYKDTIIKKLK